jgi:hypothetical protein
MPHGYMSSSSAEQPLLSHNLPSKIMPDLSWLATSRFHFFGLRNGGFFFLQSKVVSLASNPQPGDPGHCIFPSDRVTQLYPPTPGSLFVAFYDLHGCGGGILISTRGVCVCVGGEGVRSYVYVYVMGGSYFAVDLGGGGRASLRNVGFLDQPWRGW